VCNSYEIDRDALAVVNLVEHPATTFATVGDRDLIRWGSEAEDAVRAAGLQETDKVRAETKKSAPSIRLIHAATN
jgi:hypothetical protein